MLGAPKIIKILDLFFSSSITKYAISNRTRISSCLSSNGFEPWMSYFFRRKVCLYFKNGEVIALKSKKVLKIKINKD